MQDLTLDDIHSAMSNDIAVQAVTDSTIETGTYSAKGLHYKLYKTDESDEYNPNRSIGSINFELFDAQGERVGFARTKVSWELRLTDRGTLDSLNKRFDQLRKAMSLPASTPVAGVFRDFSMGVGFEVRIEEQFKVNQEDLHEMHADAKADNFGTCWVVIPAGRDDVRNHYANEGYEPIIIVKRISKSRA